MNDFQVILRKMTILPPTISANAPAQKVAGFKQFQTMPSDKNSTDSVVVLDQIGSSIGKYGADLPFDLFIMI